MDIVIVGAGEVGYHLAEILSRDRHRVSVVDTDPDKAQRIREALDVHMELGDGTYAETLNTVGASRADLVVAVTNNDHVNMLACLVARRLGGKRVILRLKDTKRLVGYRYFYKGALGFDVALSTEELVADEIVGTVREQHALEVESFADGRVQLRRLKIRQESELTCERIAGLRLPAGLLIAAVSRKDAASKRDDFFVPSGDAQLSVGDQVYLIGRSGDLDQFEHLAGARRLGHRSVVIMGAGGIGRKVASRLDGVPGLSIRILERDPAKARLIAPRFSSSVMVLVGDATDIDLLMEERVGDANVFIAGTDDDEDNMIACQLARSLGDIRTIAVVNKASYTHIYDLMGVDQAISPRNLCANRILRFVRSGSVASIAVIGDGRGEVLELEAHFKGTRTERKVRNLGLPPGVVIGALVRGDEVLIPTGETTVEEGDQVILFTLPDKLEKVEQLFRTPDAFAPTNP